MKLFCLTSFFLLVVSKLSAQTEGADSLYLHQASVQYTINAPFTSAPLPALNWVLEEGKEALKADELVRGAIKDAQLIDLTQNAFFTMKAHTSYWVNIRLSSKIDVDTLGLVPALNGNGWAWEFTFKNVEAHIYNKNGKIRVAYSGTASPYSQRDCPEKIDPSLIWLPLQKQDTLNIWLKLAAAEATQTEIQLKLINQDEIMQARQANVYYNIYFMLNGAGIVLLLIAFGLFIWFRDTIYFWFWLFLFFAITNHAGFILKNELYYFLCRNNPRLLVIGSTAFSLLMTLSLAQFGRVFIGTKRKFPKIDTAILIIACVVSVVTCTGILFRIIPTERIGNIWFSIRQIPMGIALFGFILVLFYLFFTKDKLARSFSLGVLVSAIISLIRLISTNPGENSSRLLNYAFLISTSVIILTYRFVLITQEKRRAEAEKLKSDFENLKQIQLTEQKTREAEKLEELDKIKSNFFSNITHEFRTPLTLIIEPLRQVLEQPDKPWINKVSMAKNNSQKLLELINQLLDISKLENKQMSVENERGNILEIINPLVDSFRLLAKEKGIELSFEPKNKIDLFDFDKVKVEKIISNLISNAVKFTEQGGSIQIETLQTDKNERPFFVFKITDTGLGIPENDQKYVFDRFYQVDDTNTRSQQGTGIGLSLSKELAELMGGTLTLTSSVGKGSSFTCAIPMYFEMDEQKSHSQSTATEIAPIYQALPKHTDLDLEANNIALVIEDNDELREFIISSIQENYQIIEASNGVEGLEKAIEYLPDIIISDVMMPQMTGFEVCEKIKTNPKTAHIPVILLTAKTAINSRLQGLELGADAYMNKPFHTKELLVRMKNLIDLRVLLQKKYSQALEENGEGDMEETTAVISSLDKEFLENVQVYIVRKMELEELSVEHIAHEMGMSRSQLFRKTKALLDQTPSELLTNTRLKTARQLLIEKKGNVSEIAYQVGFSNPKYFSTQFKKKYGISPSEIN